MGVLLNDYVPIRDDKDSLVYLVNQAVLIVSYGHIIIKQNTHSLGQLVVHQKFNAHETRF